MPSKLLLIAYMPTPDGKAVNPVPSFQEPDNVGKLHVQHAVDFELYNLGSTNIFLWDGVVIPPGGSFAPQKSTSLPFANDIPLKWEGEYALTHSATSVITPAPGVISR